MPVNIPAHCKLKLESKIVLELTEVEAAALDGIFGYSVEAFLKAFYEKMGTTYVKPYEAGVRSLHETMRQLRPKLAEIEDCRRKINKVLNDSD